MKIAVPNNYNFTQSRSIVAEQLGRSDSHDVTGGQQSTATELHNDEMNINPGDTSNEQCEPAVEEQSRDTVHLRRSARKTKAPVSLILSLARMKTATF